MPNIALTLMLVITNGSCCRTEVEDQLRKRRNIAHTTVLIPLDRMFPKGYLIREKQGKAF